MAFNITISIPSNYGANGGYDPASQSAGGTPGALGGTGLNGLNDQSGGANGLFSSPLMQKILELFAALFQDAMKSSNTDPSQQQGQQQPAGSGQAGGGSGGSGASNVPGGNSQTGQNVPGDNTTPNNNPANTAGNGQTAANPLLRSGSDGIGDKADGTVSDAEEAAYKTLHDDMVQADTLAHDIASDPSKATKENLDKLSDLNNKIKKELPDVSVDALRKHRSEIKPLLAAFGSDIDLAANTVDPKSDAAGTLVNEDIGMQFAIASKEGTWGFANQRDGVAGSDDSGKPNSA